MIVNADGELVSSVSPSGTARETSSVPIVVLAPGLFSTMKVRLKLRSICSASRRVITSFASPGGAGTTIFVIPVFCDQAGPLAAMTPTNNEAARTMTY
jgi:hypothetical protein